MRHLMFRGRVQGVGFRAFVAGEAERAGLEGWVRNRRAGAVEAVFAGEPATLDKVIKICRQGPPHGRVDSIDQREATADELGMRGGQSFVVLPTV